MRILYRTTKSSLPMILILSLILAASLPAMAEHGSHHGRNRAAESSERSHHSARTAANEHAARLAAQRRHLMAEHMKSPAWRAHIKRLAKQEHMQRLTARQEGAREAANHRHLIAEHMKSPAWRAHLRRLAKIEHAERLAALAQKGHAARLAKRELRVHNARMAALKAREARAHRAAVADNARAAHMHNLAAVREREARRLAHLANLAEAHRMRVAAHEARLAEREAWAARRAAQRRERETQNRISSAYGITQWGTYVDGIPVQVVLVDLNKPQIKVSAVLARDGIGTAEPFSDMIARSQPKVAVTGTFFSLDNLKPIGDIVINGNLAYFGGMGTALCITPTNHADMITVPWGHHHDWTGYDCVVACGPRLLRSGVLCLDPHAERFKDRHMLAPNSRIAVGITPANKLVFAMTRDRIYLGKLAHVMKRLGCSEAMNLDAGASTGFYVNGHMLARPGRWLTNAIVVRIRQPLQESQTPSPALTRRPSPKREG